jgi:hypothetical protein
VFAVGCAIILLLQQADLLPKPSQRLAAITLLHDMYKGESVAMSPFATVFIHLLVRQGIIWYFRFITILVLPTLEVYLHKQDPESNCNQGRKKPHTTPIISCITVMKLSFLSIQM